MHDKELGVDQHTSIDAVGKLNGGTGGAARSPEQATRDGLSASFAAAKSITAEKLGDTARTLQPKPKAATTAGRLSARPNCILFNGYRPSPQLLT